MTTCNTCGAHIADSAKHEEWHQKNDMHKLYKWFTMGFKFVNIDIKKLADKQKSMAA